MTDISPASTRLKTLLHTIRDGLHRSLDSLRQASAGNKLPDVLVNDGDVKAAALYLRDLGLKYDGLRLDAEFARLRNRCMDEWFASMADGESLEYRDRLTELFGPFPSQGNSDDSVVADRRVAIVGCVAQLSAFVDELIRSVTALAGTQPDAIGQPPAAKPSEAAGGGEESGSNTAMAKKSKRSTVRGEAETKLIGALTDHHRYDEGGCMEWGPLGSNALADKAKVGRGSANRFFNKWFGSAKKAKDGYENYRIACRDKGKLIATLKVMNDDMPRPGEILFGRIVPDEAENPDHRGGTRRKPRASELHWHNDR